MTTNSTARPLTIPLHVDVDATQEPHAGRKEKGMNRRPVKFSSETR